MLLRVELNNGPGWSALAPAEDPCLMQVIGCVNRAKRVNKKEI